MNIKEVLQGAYSKKQVAAIVDYIGDDAQRFDELVGLFLEGEYRLTQRAAWPLSYAAIAHPALVRKHLKKLVDNLDKPGIHDAIKRNTLRLLREVEIPDAVCGKLADICFAYLRSAEEPVAIQSFAMRVLLRICQRYPELKQELQPLVEDLMPFGKPAILSAGRDVLKQLRKL